VQAGLGDAARIDRVEVRWPNGNEEVWRDVPVKTIVTLTEGKANAGLPGQ
jgi:ASPIC and UnbV